MSAEFFARAACKDQPSSLWFPENGEEHRAGDYRAGKQVCEGCDVRAECLEYALTNRMEYGLWGGLIPKERQLLRRRRAALRRKEPVVLDPLPMSYRMTNGGPAQHGTRSMRARGCGCESCCEVERAYQSARAALRKVDA